MKRCTLLFFKLSVIVLFASCQKEPVPNEPATPLAKVKTYSENLTSSYLGHIAFNYDISYDADNKLISAISTSAPGTKLLLTYPSTSKYYTDFYENNILQIHEDFFLNSNSFIDSTFQYNNTKDSSTEKYFYNTNNQVTKIKEYSYSKITGSELSNTVTNTYNADGDLVTSADTNKNNETYEYYTDLNYTAPLVFGPANINSTKKFHLIKKHTFSSNGSFVTSSDNTYTFDSNNRISTEKQTFTDGSILLKTYTYF